VSVPTGSDVGTVILRLVAAAVSVWAGVKIGWGSPRWHSRTSLDFVQQNPIPWAVWGVLFLLTATLIVVPKRLKSWYWPRVCGWWLGFVLYGYYGVSLDVAAWGQPHTAFNPVVVAAVNGWALLWVVAAAVAMDGD